MILTPSSGTAGHLGRMLADFAALSNRLGVDPISFCTLTVDSARVFWDDPLTEDEPDSEIDSKWLRE